MAATGHRNSVIVGDVVLSMMPLRSVVTRYVRPLAALNITIAIITSLLEVGQTPAYNKT